ncbi:hypothetical protein [Deinococcus sp.]|uniref:hypothetical protein n=1 Tax=Deinococcus sp. TaxID=47478 RepID=UPI0025E6FD89|nr:hypothetical protein [Deinococcus sp.]
MTTPPDSPRPTIVCLCGSTRFLEAFDAASLAETLSGNIVLSIGSHRTPDAAALAHLPEAERELALIRLARLHAHKIELADEVLVIDVGGYIGESTRREIEYARSGGKPVRYWQDP